MGEQESPEKNGIKEQIIANVKAFRDREVAGGKWKYGLQTRVQAVRQAIVGVFTNLKRIRNVVSNNYELGKKHYNLGNFHDAIMRFKMVVWLEPNHVSAWCWLGAAYLAIHKKEAARGALRKALQLQPGLEKAREMLKIAEAKSEENKEEQNAENAGGDGEKPAE